MVQDGEGDGDGALGAEPDRGRAYDAIVTGASIDSVALACGLARAGHAVALLDAGATLGGPSRPIAMRDERGGVRDFTVDLAPLGPRGVLPAVIRALDLERHGLALVPAAPPALVTRTGPSVELSRDINETNRRLDALKAGESERFHRLRCQLARARTLVSAFLTGLPVDPGLFRDRSSTVLREVSETAGRFGEPALFDLFHLSSVSCADRLKNDLQVPALRTLVAGMALVHQGASPMAPGSALSLLDLPFLDGAADGGDPWFGARVLGGASALATALRRAVHAAGVDLYTETEVSEIIVADNRVQGVALWDGTQLDARMVVSGHDMKKTFLNLIPWKSVPEDLLRAVGRSDTAGRVARLAVSLNDLGFLPAAWQASFPSLACFADGIAAMEAAGDDAEEGRLPTAPWLTLTLHDDGAAPGSARPPVLMVSVHYAPGQFHDGEWTPARREVFRDVILNRIAAAWPGFLDAAEDVALWLPGDIEQETGRVGGHLTGGDWAPDRLYWNRPLPELARHDCAIEGLVLCGPDTGPSPREPGIAGLYLVPRLAQKLAAPERVRRFL